MRRFSVAPLPLDGLKRIERTVASDTRGQFSRLFCAEDLAGAGWDEPVAQVNHSTTFGSGTLRGMHYQVPPNAETKLVFCIRGRIWDVALDLRQGSSTFLGVHGEELSETNHHGLLIPKGFAHGFQVLGERAELIYFHSAPYAPDAERRVHPLDPMLDIGWPLAARNLSNQDSSAPFLEQRFEGVAV